MKPRLLFVSNLFPDAASPYRGLDNATVLHHLASTYDIRVLSPRPWLPLISPKFPRAPRPIDIPFKPLYIRTPYLPKIGGLANHHLMAKALRGPMATLHRSFPWDHALGSWLFPDACALHQTHTAIAPRTPFTLIAQGSDVHAYLQSPPRRRAILHTLNAAQATITRSRSLAETLAAAGADPQKLHPITNGIDTRLFHYAGRAAARVELNLKIDDSLLLFVGNLLPVKDPIQLVKNFTHLLPRLPHHRLRLILIGQGPLQKALTTLIHASSLQDRIQLTGPLPAEAVARYMRAADLLCMTSLNEGLPNVVLEAQACGLPILSTHVGGLNEVVDQPWKGTLTPLHDPAAWVDAACHLIDSPTEGTPIATLGATRTWAATAAAYHAVMSPAPHPATPPHP